MPLDSRPFTVSRAELGIGEEDVVFALVSRAIPEKGWEVAIRALELAQAQTERRLWLLLCGTGSEADRLSLIHGGRSNVRFLGFQDRVHGVYRLADCALLPSRFEGESFPLTLIQALQASTPVIATNIGEIRHIIQGDGRKAGILLQPDQNDTTFIARIAEAMLAMEPPAARSRFRRDAEILGTRYDMAVVAAAYTACYDAAISRHRLARVLPAEQQRAAVVVSPLA